MKGCEIFQWKGNEQLRMALTCYYFLFVFVQRLASGETGWHSVQLLYFMRDNTHLNLCHHLSCTNVRLIEWSIFFNAVFKKDL